MLLVAIERPEELCSVDGKDVIVERKISNSACIFKGKRFPITPDNAIVFTTLDQ